VTYTKEISIGRKWLSGASGDVRRNTCTTFAIGS